MSKFNAPLFIAIALLGYDYMSMVSMGVVVLLALMVGSMVRTYGEVK